jgi:hypothetical protein
MLLELRYSEILVGEEATQALPNKDQIYNHRYLDKTHDIHLHPMAIPPSQMTLRSGMGSTAHIPHPWLAAIASHVLVIRILMVHLPRLCCQQRLHPHNPTEPRDHPEMSLTKIDDMSLLLPKENENISIIRMEGERQTTPIGIQALHQEQRQIPLLKEDIEMTKTETERIVDGGRTLPLQE